MRCWKLQITRQFIFLGRTRTSADTGMLLAVSVPGSFSSSEPQAQQELAHLDIYSLSFSRNSIED